MTSRGGAGAAGGAKPARVAATKALEDSAFKLWPEAMLRALRAGANASDIECGIRDEYRCFVPKPVAWVLNAMPFVDEVVDNDDAYADAQRAASLRVLVEHGCLDKQWHVDAALLDAVSLDYGPAVVRCLLDAGADPALVEAGYSDGNVDFFSDDRGPPQLVCMVNLAETARLLLAAGASAEATDGRGNTPLHALHHTIVPKKVKGLVAALVDAGADVDARNNAGSTPLGMAAVQPARSDGMCVIHDLLAVGADPAIADHTGGHAA